MKVLKDEKITEREQVEVEFVALAKFLVGITNAIVMEL